MKEYKGKRRISDETGSPGERVEVVRPGELPTLQGQQRVLKKQAGSSTPFERKMFKGGGQIPTFRRTLQSMWCEMGFGLKCPRREDLSEAAPTTQRLSSY